MAPELAGAVVQCVKCQKKIRVPGDPPLAPPKAAASTSPPVEEEPIVVQVISEETKETTSAQPTSNSPAIDEEPVVVECVANEIGEMPIDATKPTFDEYWKKSAAVKEELARLKKMELPKFDEKFEPLPELLPKGAAAMGEPIASLGPWEHSVKHWLFFPGLCMFVACFCCIGGVGTAVVDKQVVQEAKAIEKNRNNNKAKLSTGAGLAIVILLGSCIFIAIGVSLLFPHRTNSANLRFWLCKRGIIWSGKDGIGFARWEEITEAYDDLKSDMVVQKKYGINQAVLVKYEVYRIRIDDELVIFTGGFAFAHYVICKASLANFQSTLAKIYAGQAVSLSAIDLNGYGLHCQGKSYAWSTLEEADLTRKGKNYDLMLEGKKKKKPIAINAHNISLAPAALALCRVLIEDYKAFPRIEPSSIEKPNPFAF